MVYWKLALNPTIQWLHLREHAQKRWNALQFKNLPWKLILLSEQISGHTFFTPPANWVINPTSIPPMAFKTTGTCHRMDSYPRSLHHVCCEVKLTDGLHDTQQKDWQCTYICQWSPAIKEAIVLDAFAIWRPKHANQQAYAAKYRHLHCHQVCAPALHLHKLQ